MSAITAEPAVPVPSASGPKPGEQRWAVSAVLTLNAATGVVEAVSYAHLGHLFAAYVTGTVVLAGLRLGVGGIAALVPYAVAFAGFIAGSVVGGSLVHSAGGRTVRGFVTALVGELALLALALSAYVTVPADGALVALGLLAGAMAIQFSATKSLAVPDLGFAAATGLIHSLVHDVNAARHAPARLPRKLLAIATLLAGAFAGGLISQGSAAAALLLAVVLVATALILTRSSRRRAREVGA